MNFICLDHEEFCATQETASVVAIGAMTGPQQLSVTFPMQTYIDMTLTNIGQASGSANSNEFQPVFILTPAHMQSAVGRLTDTRVFRMYNQIVINLKLIPGDSGTCIYIFGTPNQNGCIGMVIGMCGGLSIVTPLNDILKRISN